MGHVQSLQLAERRWAQGSYICAVVDVGVPCELSHADNGSRLLTGRQVVSRRSSFLHLESLSSPNDDI
jgi:hypothetical protein